MSPRVDDPSTPSSPHHRASPPPHPGESAVPARESAVPPRESAVPPRESAVPPRESAVPRGEFAVPAPDLATRQAELVAALVAGGPVPAGFDADRIGATRRALLRKRAGEAAKYWPLLAASLGADWSVRFARHHDGRESNGALRDGWDLARALRDRGELGPGAATELAERESENHYDGYTAPRPRAAVRGRRILRRLLGRH